MTSARRKARGIAFQALFEIDAVGHERVKVLGRLREEKKLSEDTEKSLVNVLDSLTKNFAA